MIIRYWFTNVFLKHPSRNIFVFLWLRWKYHDCERDRLYSVTRNSHIVRDGFLFPLHPFLKTILNPCSNRRYTPVESKLNVEFSRFTSASFSRVAGRLLFLGLRLLGFASISNVNSRRSREEDAEQSTRGVARENKSTISKKPATMSMSSLDILINAIMESRWTNPE